MKYHVVSLLALLLLLVFQTPQAITGGFARGGFASRGFVGAGPHQFVSRRVIIINPGLRVVRFSPFANRLVVGPRQFVGNRFIIQEPFFCFGHGVGFFDEPLFFDHLHRFHGLAFEDIPGAVVRSGSQVFFFGN